MTSDLGLLEDWARGDQAAGEVLFDRQFDSLYAFFWNKVRSEAEAEDLVQVTLLACVEKRDQLRPGSNFRAFVFRVARNRLYNHWRDERKYESIEGDNHSVAALDPSPSSVLRVKGDRRLLVDALRSIPLDAQIVLELFYWERLTGPHLAEVLEIPEGTVRGRIRRAREQLKDRVLELTRSPALAQATTQGLERWADEIRALQREQP